MKKGQLIAVNGNIYEYGGMTADNSSMHRVYDVEIDEEGRLTSTHNAWYFTDEELTEGFNKINLTQEQWYGVVECIIRQNHNVTNEEITEATDDIVGRCFAYGRPEFDELEGYIDCYMNR